MWNWFTVSGKKRKFFKGPKDLPIPFTGFRGYKQYDPSLHTPEEERRYAAWAVGLQSSFESVDPDAFRDWLLDSTDYRPTQKALIGRYLKGMRVGASYLLRLIWNAATKQSRAGGKHIERILDDVTEIARGSNPDFQPSFDFIEANMPTTQEYLDAEYKQYLEDLATTFPENVPAKVREDVTNAYGGSSYIPPKILTSLVGLKWRRGTMSVEDASALLTSSKILLPEEPLEAEYFESFSATSPIIVLVDPEGHQEFIGGWGNLVVAGAEGRPTIPVLFGDDQRF